MKKRTSKKKLIDTIELLTKANHNNSIQMWKQIKEAQQTAESVVKKLVKIRFDRRPAPNFYQVIVEFDGNAMGYISGNRNDLEMIAEIVGMQVTAEIASSRFIKAARKESTKDGIQFP